MKNAILTLIISLNVVLVQANHFSNLTLNMPNKATYHVEFDRQAYSNPGNTFMINNVMPGRYPLAVIEMVRSRYGVQRNVIYKGVIDIPAGSNVTAFVDKYNRLQLSYSPIVMVNPYNPGHCGNDNVYYPPMPVAMNPAAFSQLKNTIINQWFDSGKLQVAKQGIMNNPVTAQQVSELMQLFSFENSRLEIAKMAFANTIDKQNYYVVNNQFWFSGSVAELDQYLSNM